MRKENLAAIASLFLVFLGIIFRAAWDNWSQILIFYFAAIFYLWYLIYIFASDNQRGDSLLLWGWFLFFFWQCILVGFSQQKYISSQSLLNYFSATVILILASNGNYVFLNKKTALVSLLILSYLFLAIGYFSLPKPNFLAAYLVIFSGGLLNLFTDEKQYPARIIFLGLNLLLSFLLRSYSALLAVGLFFLYQLYFYRRQVPELSPLVVDILLLGLIIILAVLLIKKISLADTVNRLIWWKSGWEMFKHHPLTGVGAGLFERYFVNFRTDGLGSIYVHNYFLGLLAESGLISALIFTFWFLFLFWKIPAVRPLIFMTFIFNFFDYGLNIPGVQWSFMFFLGVYISRFSAKRRNLLSGLLLSIVFLIILANILPWGIRNFFTDRCLAKANFYCLSSEKLSLAERKIDCSRAMNYLLPARSISPDDSRILTMSAMCFQIAGKHSPLKRKRYWKKALQNQQQACAYEKSLSSNWYYLYQLARMNNNWKLANLARKKYLLLAPSSNLLVKH